MTDEKKNSGTNAFGGPLPYQTPEEIKKNIENILAYEKRKEEHKEHTLEGFTYVPELQAHVADELSIYGKNWFECKKELFYRNSRMLTPAEFWIYTIYYTQNKPQKVKSIFKETEREWLDGLVENKKDLIVRAEIQGPSGNFHIPSSGQYTWSSVPADRYPDVVPQTQGEFDDVDLKTGLPSLIKHQGTFDYFFQYRGLELTTNALTIGFYFSKKKLRLDIANPYDAVRIIGVREVKRLNTNNK